MLLMYGQKIKNMIIFYLNDNEKFKNTFRFIKRNNTVYPNFDSCFFTAEELEINDSKLNIESELFYKTYSPLKEDRKEKLQKLSQKI